MPSVDLDQFMHYRLHGRSLTVESDNLSVGRAIHEILEYFGFASVQIQPAQPAIRLSFLTRGPVPVLPDAACQVAQHNGVTVWRTETHFYFLCNDTSIIRLDLASNTGQGFLASSMWRTPGVVRLDAVNLVIHSVLLLLRQGGFFPLHAAALAQDGVGFLLTAESDSGKSTLALSLVRAGWCYLSDDSVLLKPGTEAIEAYPLRRDFGVDPEATALFPEIEANWQPFLTDERKRRIDMAMLYPGQAVERCTPGVLIFPTIAAQPDSVLTPVSKEDALFRLMRQSILLTLEPRLATKHLDVLNQLVRQAKRYTLLAGRDVKENPAQVARLLARAASE